MTALIIALFIAAALLSIPIARALVLASVGGLLIIDRCRCIWRCEQMLAQTQSFPLIAIPFFMLTGALMVSGENSGRPREPAVDDDRPRCTAGRRRWACCRRRSSAACRARLSPMPSAPSARC